jgi:hypothetical protein
MYAIFYSIPTNNEQKYYHKSTLHQSHGVPVSNDMPCDDKKRVSPPNKGWFEECNLIFAEELTRWIDANIAG